MKLGQLILEALESLAGNKVRSALTMLGIIIGVGAVIAMMSIGAGAQQEITNQINKIGTNLLYVASGGDATNPKPITLADAQAIADPNLAPDVIHVAPVMQGQLEVSIPGKSTSTSLVGVTPTFFLVQDAPVAEGQQISQANLDNYSAVVILGTQVADDLFARKTNLVGETVRIKGQIFKVIGVLKEQGGTGFGNADNRIMVPLTTAQLRLLHRSEPNQVDMLYVQAASAEVVPSATNDVAQILRARHMNPQGKDDFDIMSTQSLLDTVSTVTGIFTAFLGGIAGISLLVGGIGIMNIMLVTVTERTREIGLRKAVGARKSDIRVQFLVESSMLSLGGGMIGILVGWGLALLIGKIATASGNPFNPVVELNAVLMATLFSAAVGLFFGIYPANRAANLQPVEALRTE
jgi:putative ABC transport system permease protein